MENVLLVLNENHVKGFANLIDEAFDFKELIPNRVIGGAVEAFDNKGAQIALNFGNKRASVYIPDDIKDELHAAFDDVLDGDGDYKIAIDNALSIIDQLADKLDVKDWVQASIDGLIDLIRLALHFLLEKKQNQ